MGKGRQHFTGKKGNSQYSLKGGGGGREQTALQPISLNDLVLQYSWG